MQKYKYFKSGKLATPVLTTAPSEFETFTGWKESIGHGSKLKGFSAHIYADLTD